MQIEAFFHPATFTLTYVVYDDATKDAVIIDPVLDYDPASSQTSTTAVRALVNWVRERGLRVHWVLETHAHADHLTAAPLLGRELDSPSVIGRDITAVQRTFKTIFGLGEDFPTDGRQFGRLVGDADVIEAGSLKFEVIHTPGHTPACVSYRIEDAVFTGDALFMPDYGTGRCDFPGGSAEALYHSVHDRLYALPDATRVFVGHDYQPGGRALAWETTIGASKQGNEHLRSSTSKAEFVARRQARDATLAAPRLLFPSVQVNVAGGQLPAPGPAGIRHLHLPLNLFRPTDDVGNEA